MSLEVKGLSYTAGSFSLESISFSLPGTAILGIGGRNGSGKSTLLKLLYGFLRKRSGEILIDGRPLGKMSPREISRRIAVVSQEVWEPFNFTAGEVVKLSGFSRQDNSMTVEEAMAGCGIAQLESRPFTELSGGEKRLVLISAALYQDASIILMDEPTAFLDVDKEMKVVQIIRSLKALGKTLVLVLHDINLLNSLCDKVVLLKQGKMLTFGDREDVLTLQNLENAYSIRFSILEDAGPYKFAPADYGRL